MKKLIALTNVALFAGMIYVNYLGGIGAINNIGTGEVSGLYPTLFTPAVLTFSIWGIIYLFNLFFVVYQVFKAFKLPENFDLKLNQGFFFVTITNTVWIFAWHRLAIGYSLFLMLILLVFLLVSYSRATSPKYKSEYAAEYMNFSIYLGWISVATIANVSIFLTTIGVPRAGTIAAILTLAILVAALGLALFYLFKLKNVWYPLVLLWAFYGIYVARSTDMAEGAAIVKAGAIGALIILMSGLAYYRIMATRNEVN